jgi:hypothetical protein
MPKRSPDGRPAGAHMQVAGGGWSTVSGASIESSLPIIASPRSACVPPAGADGWLHATWGAARRQGPAQRQKRPHRNMPEDAGATACEVSRTPLHVTTASGDRRPLPDPHANGGGPRRQRPAGREGQGPEVAPLAPPDQPVPDRAAPGASGLCALCTYAPGAPRSGRARAEAAEGCWVSAGSPETTRPIFPTASSDSRSRTCLTGQRAEP